MKSTNSLVQTVAAFSVTIAISNFTSAKTLQVGPGWAYQLQNTINAAAPGDTIQITGDIRMGKAVNFNKTNLILDGQEFTIFDDFNGNPFMIEASGVTIKNTKFQGSTARNWRGFIFSEASQDLTIDRCTFNSGFMGLNLHQTPPKNLKFTGNVCNSVWYAACWGGRNVLLVAGANDDAKFQRATQAGPLFVDNNQVLGDFQGGFRFDCGNDGNIGGPDANRNHPLRARVQWEPTRFGWFGRSYVRDNTISGSRRFGIGFARGAGVTVQGNRVITSSTPDSFIEGIHFENQAQNISAFNNHVTIGHSGSGPSGISGFGVVGFADGPVQDKSLRPRFGCSNILLGWGNKTDKKFADTKGEGVKAHNVTNCTFNNLNMSGMTSPSKPYAFATFTINGWNKPQDRAGMTFTQTGNNPQIDF